MALSYSIDESKPLCNLLDYIIFLFSFSRTGIRFSIFLWKGFKKTYFSSNFVNDLNLLFEYRFDFVFLIQYSCMYYEDVLRSSQVVYIRSNLWIEFPNMSVISMSYFFILFMFGPFALFPWAFMTSNYCLFILYIRPTALFTWNSKKKIIDLEFSSNTITYSRIP